MLELYGDLREAFGWKNAEIDALSLVEVEEIVAHWRKKPTMGALLRSYFGVDRGPTDATEVPSDEPIPVSQEQLDRLVASMHATAAKSRRDPFR